jgi:hypothetical protein
MINLDKKNISDPDEKKPEESEETAGLYVGKAIAFCIVLLLAWWLSGAMNMQGRDGFLFIFGATVCILYYLGILISNYEQKNYETAFWGLVKVIAIAVAIIVVIRLW